VVSDVLDTEEDIDPVVEEYAAVVDTLIADWYARGQLDCTYAGLSLWQRLLKVLNRTWLIRSSPTWTFPYRRVASRP
jgi:hypothetical protein